MNGEQRVIPYGLFIYDIQDVAAFLRRRLGHVWPVLVRIYFCVDWVCNLCRVPYTEYVGHIPRPVIRRDSRENVDLADFFDGHP